MVANRHADAPGEPLREAPAPVDYAWDAGNLWGPRGEIRFPGKPLGDAPAPVDSAGNAGTPGGPRREILVPGKPLTLDQVTRGIQNHKNQTSI